MGELCMHRLRILIINIFLVIEGKTNGPNQGDGDASRLWHVGVVIIMAYIQSCTFHCGGHVVYHTSSALCSCNIGYAGELVEMIPINIRGEILQHLLFIFQLLKRFLLLKTGERE